MEKTLKNFNTWGCQAIHSLPAENGYFAEFTPIPTTLHLSNIHSEGHHLTSAEPHHPQKEQSRIVTTLVEHNNHFDFLLRIRTQLLIQPEPSSAFPL